MTSPDRSKGSRSRDEVLAGEYVLGALPLEERRKVEQRMRSDRTFAEVVGRWEQNLSLFSEEEQDVAPPRVAAVRREKRSPAAVSKSHLLWNSLAFWRAATFASLFLVAGVIAFSTRTAVQPFRPGQQMTAALTGTGEATALSATYDRLTGRLSFAPTAGGGAQQKSLEVWLLRKDGSPESLGILAPGSQGMTIVPRAKRSELAAGDVVALSAEPFGGSPTGKPGGPLIASGALQAH